jgi:hypothetical protein
MPGPPRGAQAAGKVPARGRGPFSAYDAGSDARTPDPITVPWARLMPLLAAKQPPECILSSSDQG